MAYRYATDTRTDTQPAHMEARGPVAPQSIHLDWQPRKYVHMNECKYVRLFVCVCVRRYMYMYAHTYHLLRICHVYVYAVLKFYSAAASRRID